MTGRNRWLTMLMVAVWPLAAQAACIVDAREITIERHEESIRQSVRLVRVFDEEGDSDSHAYSSSTPAVEWSCRALNAGSLKEAMSELGIVVGRDSNLVPSNTLFTLYTAAYETPSGTLPDRWWASYVPDAASSATRFEFVLRVPAGEEVAHDTAGTWTFSQSHDAEGRMVLRWVDDRGTQDVDTADMIVPWILAGSRVTWDEVGEGLRDVVMGAPDSPWSEPMPKSVETACRALSGAGREPAPPNVLKHAVWSTGRTTSVSSAVLHAPANMNKAFPPMQIMSQYSAAVVLLRLFDGFQREPPTPGFRPRSTTEFFASRSGTCKDFSRVLLDLLAARGQPAWLVLRATGLNDLADTIPCPDVFDHVQVAALDANGDLIVLDPFAGRMKRLSNIKPTDAVWIYENHLFIPWLRDKPAASAAPRSVAIRIFDQGDSLIGEGGTCGESFSPGSILDQGRTHNPWLCSRAITKQEAETE